MVQEQLVEYVSSQMKLGVSRDAIKAALSGAGWAPADIEDTLKKTEGLGKPAAPASVSPSAGAFPTGSSTTGISMKPATATTPASFSVSGMTGGMPKTAEPQSIKVSDLVSGNPSVKKGPEIMRSANLQPMKPVDLTRLSVTPEKKGGTVMKIVGIVLIVGFAALAGFFYWQNTGLTAKVATIGNTSTDVTANIASLTAQVAAQDASNTALAAQVASLTAENALLLNNLSFVATPSGAATSSEAVSVIGKLSVAKAVYTLTTPYGVLVYVQNSKDAKVITALTALATSTDPVQLTGTHVLGSQFVTVTAVNSVAL